MAQNCDISKDILFNCSQPPVRGQKNRLILLPKSDIDFANVEFNSTNHMIIEKIQMKIGKRAFVYTGNSDLIFSDTTMVRDENDVRESHRIPFMLRANTPDIKLEIEALKNYPDGFVAILEQNYKGANGNAKYEVFGWDVGLRLMERANADGRNIHNLVLATPEGAEEPHLPRNFYKTSEANTDTMVAALLVAQSS